MIAPDTRLRGTVAYGVLLGTGLSIALIFTAIGPVLSAISVYFGGGAKGNIIAQSLMTLPSIGVIVGGPFAGVLVERIGARRTLFVALFAYGLTGSAGLYIADAYPLLATRLLLGIAGAGVATSATALIGEMLEGNRRVRALGYWSAVGSGGSVISILLAGSIAHMGGWQGPFALYGVAFVLLAFALFSLRPSSGSAEISGQTAVVPKGALLALWPIYALLVAICVAVFMTGIQVSFLLAANGIDSPKLQSWIIAAASLGSMTGAMTYGLVQQRIGHGWCFVLSLSLMAMGNLIMGTQQEVALFAVGCLLNGWGGGMTIPFFASRIVERTPLEVRGRAFGLMYTMIFVGEFANPLVVTPLSLQFGIHTAFVVVGCLTAAGAVVAAWKRQ